MELKIDLHKEKKKSVLKMVLGIGLFIVSVAVFIITTIKDVTLKPILWFAYGLLALNGIINFVEGLGFPFESFFGKAYIWINNEFVSLKASAFDKKQFVNWNDIQSIDNKPNKFIIQKTDNTTVIIDRSKFDYVLNMKIKEAIIDITEEKNIRGVENDYTQWQKEHYADMSVSELNKKAVEYAKNNPINM